MGTRCESSSSEAFGNDVGAVVVVVVVVVDWVVVVVVVVVIREGGLGRNGLDANEGFSEVCCESSGFSS